MDISIVSMYPVINEGLIYILKEKYSNIASYLNLDTALESLMDNESILIYALFKNNSKEIDDLISYKRSKNFKLLIIDFNQINNMFFKFSREKVEGYILGNFAKEDIEYAIHKVSNGNRFYDRELLYHLVDQEDSAASAKQKKIAEAPLTTREQEILYQLAKGLSNYEIASVLNISENTVKKHISNIFVKINVKDRTQATIYAYDSGLISKPDQAM